jgi:hypothetical protein
MSTPEMGVFEILPLGILGPEIIKGTLIPPSYKVPLPCLNG